MYRIYYDSIHEGAWFQDLHPTLAGAELHAFPSPAARPPSLAQVLAYDRPDIVLLADGDPILVLERTVEVPSGHNVGQRFARLVAAAQMGLPVVYFGPYAAYKHGGATQGPRYMNLRLFYALDRLAEIEGAAVTTINWPVDTDYEIVTEARKDDELREYLKFFFERFRPGELDRLNKEIMASEFESRQLSLREDFIRREVVKPEQYKQPPSSVFVGKRSEVPELRPFELAGPYRDECTFYRVGMNRIRSDPYTGMAMLYAYLYCGGMNSRKRDLVLYFPNITVGEWDTAAAGRERKDIRLFRLTADAILFSDALRPQAAL